MDFLVYLPLTLLYLAARSTLAPGLPLPDLALAAVFYLAYDRPSLSGVFLAFLLGYMDDVFSGGVIGATSFSLVLAYAAAHLAARKVHFSTAAMQVLGVSVLAAVKGLATYLLLGPSGPDAVSLVYVVPGAVVTALSAPFLIALFVRIDGLVKSRSGGDALK